MIRIFAAVAALALGATMVAAQQDVPKERENLMKGMGKAFYGTLARMARDQAPYNQEQAAAALTELEALSKKLPDVFVEAGKGDVPDSRFGTSPKVWENKADFEAKVAGMKKAIDDQKGKIKDLDTLKASAKAIGDACDSCHEGYRIRKS